MADVDDAAAHANARLAALRYAGFGNTVLEAMMHLTTEVAPVAHAGTTRRRLEAKEGVAGRPLRSKGSSNLPTSSTYDWPYLLGSALVSLTIIAALVADRLGWLR